MSRVQIHYGNAALFVGPAPGSGNHFLTYSGQLSNEFRHSPQIRNLVADITRVQSLSYDFNVPRQHLVHLGGKSTFSKPIIEHPTIDIGFDYILMGVKNEARLGLTVNYAHFERSLSGTPHFTNNTGVDLLSGMTSRDQTQPTGDPFWPLPQREPKNLFLAISKSGEMIETSPFVWKTGDTSEKIDFNVRDYDVAAFGNCYMTSYAARGSVGSPPMASVRFLAENVNFHSSGSGAWTPAVSPIDRKPISGKYFRIPSYYPDEGPSVLKPGDMAVDITVIKSNVTGVGFDVDFRDMWLDSFSLGMQLDREPLRSLGFKIPYDRPINYPVFASLDFRAIVNEHQTGTLLNLINHDLDYFLSLRLKNPNCPGEVLDVPPYKANAEAVRYDFVKAKLAGVSWSDSIGGRKRGDFSFVTELTPDDFSKGGFFISGLLNIDKVEDYLVTDSGDGVDKFFITPSGKLVVALLPIVV